jgi:hypothetical protein
MDDYALWGTKPFKFNSSADDDIIDCYKNVAIWGGLIFIAGASIQPSLLPRR